MAAYYLDTSALVKRYTREHGSTWLVSPTARRAGHDLYTVRLTGPEAIAALHAQGPHGRVDGGRRRTRQPGIPPPQAAPPAHRRGGGGGSGAGHGPGRAVWTPRVRCGASGRSARGRRHAGGLGLPALTFVSADNDQRQAAVAEGLLVEDPNAYP